MPLSPSFQRSRHLRTSSLVVPGSRAHEGVREVVFLDVVLAREVVGFGLALGADLAGVLFGLVHVVGGWGRVVEEFAEQVKAAVLGHHVGAQEEIAGFGGWRL